MLQRTIIRCEVYPHQFGAAEITRVDGAPPSFPKGGAIEFQIAIFSSRPGQTRQLEDLSAFSSAALRVRQTNAEGALLLDSVSPGAEIQLDPSLSLATWDTGSGWHIRCYFPSSLTAVAAGTHYLCLYGIVSNPAADYCVLGQSSITCISVGTLGAESGPVPGGTVPSMEQIGLLLSQMLAQYVKKYGDPGETLTLVGADGTAVEQYVEEGLIKNRQLV